jgi:hypothetical protein
MNNRFRKIASRAEETRSKSIITMNHMENVKKFTNTRKSLPHQRFLQSRESTLETNVMPSIDRINRPITKQIFERKNYTAMGSYNERPRPIPTLKKELSKSNTKSHFEQEMDNEVSSINYHSLPMSPAKMLRDADDMSIIMPPLMEAHS